MFSWRDLRGEDGRAGGGVSSADGGHPGGHCEALVLPLSDFKVHCMVAAEKRTSLMTWFLLKRIIQVGALRGEKQNKTKNVGGSGRM